MRKKTVMALGLLAALFLHGCGSEAESARKYELAEVHPVGGRQGICTEEKVISGKPGLEAISCRNCIRMKA